MLPLLPDMIVPADAAAPRMPFWRMMLLCRSFYFCATEYLHAFSRWRRGLRLPLDVFHSFSFALWNGIYACRDFPRRHALFIMPSSSGIRHAARRVRTCGAYVARGVAQARAAACGRCTRLRCSLLAPFARRVSRLRRGAMQRGTRCGLPARVALPAYAHMSCLATPAATAAAREAMLFHRCRMPPDGCAYKIFMPLIGILPRRHAL